MISFHLARADNGVIGVDGGLPWDLPEDFAHFKRTTLGHVVVMGRKTYESMGRPLPRRTTGWRRGRRQMSQPPPSYWAVPGLRPGRAARCGRGTRT